MQGIGRNNGEQGRLPTMREIERARSNSTAPGARRRVRNIGLSALAGVAVLFSPFKLCLLALIWSIPCPGCGMTRAARALAQGDVARAFAIHPLSPVVVPLLVIVIAIQAFAYVHRGRPFGTGRVPRIVEWAGASVALLLLLVWMARFAGFFGGPVSLT